MAKPSTLLLIALNTFDLPLDSDIERKPGAQAEAGKPVELTEEEATRFKKLRLVVEPGAAAQPSVHLFPAGAKNPGHFTARLAEGSYAVVDTKGNVVVPGGNDRVKALKALADLSEAEKSAAAEKPSTTKSK